MRTIEVDVTALRRFSATLVLALTFIPAYAATDTTVLAQLRQSLEQNYANAKAGDGAAVAALRAEADQGNKSAQLMMGNLFANGMGVARDYKEAFAWFTKAAEQGVSEAQYNLGQLYRRGHGVQANDKAAASWYRKAADQGNPGAMYNLAGMYLEGRGVPQSEAEAKRLLQKAAALGHQGAQRALTQM